MLKIENSLLHHHINNLSLKLAFTKLKSNQRQSIQSAGDPTSLTNKALYLSYMEEVLQNK